MSFRDWQVGMEVICVETATDDKGLKLALPQVGEKYTLREISPSITDGQICVYLNEIVNADGCYRAGAREVYGEVGWSARWFRKVEPRKTSIALLERFLLNPNAPVREDA